MDEVALGSAEVLICQNIAEYAYCWALLKNSPLLQFVYNLLCVIMYFSA